jgi:biopolymer transport protein ExbD
VKTASSSDKYQLVTEINMIPFIDVSLVLLIIFMIMTPILVKEQIKINLPTTKSVHTPVDSRRLVQVEVTANGAIRVDGIPVTADGAYDAIRKRLTDPETQPVVISADRDVAFEKVVVAMDAAKRCGAKHLGVSVKHGADAKAIAPSDSAEDPTEAPKKSGTGTKRTSSASTDTPKRHTPAAATDSTKRRTTTTKPRAAGSPPK